MRGSKIKLLIERSPHGRVPRIGIMWEIPFGNDKFPDGIFSLF